MPRMDGHIDQNLIVILGPTASGKTRAGVEVAGEVDGEIVSADSRQVFRGMNIGTGKDLDEYGSIPYHLIDIADPGSEFSVFDFQRLFGRAFSEIRCRGRVPVLVGGTGLYLDSVLLGYRMAEVPPDERLRERLAAVPLEDLRRRLEASNPVLHNTTDLLDRDRIIRAIEIAEFRGPKPAPALPDIKPAVFGIFWPREALRARITDRLRRRLKEGMIEEVRGLLAAGVPPEKLDEYGLEYRFISRHLRGEINRNDMFQKLNSAIHQFAKKQETWFRRMERKGVRIRWVEGGREPGREILRIFKDEPAGARAPLQGRV
ncbi:MAG TPA: tRNA (adenosine(37)-N6)-dimethylallyltransferase MiaA [Thermodesulfobacteriota bacterium]|nr:tRNA (adenosine(37)-N6)-dimethylallyltransferase MiaA [Thermodesulfobacteriota bacterium]